MAPLLLGLGIDLSVVLGKDPLPAPPRGTTPLLTEAIPAAARIDDGERSLTCDRQEVLVARDEQIGIPLDRRREEVVGWGHSEVARI